MKLASDLKAYRKQMGKSQEQMAKDLDVLLRAYQRWESGESQPRKPMLEKLESLLYPSDQTKKRGA